LRDGRRSDSARSSAERKEMAMNTKAKKIAV
jgi:hypothetical protein